MNTVLDRVRSPSVDPREAHIAAMIQYLRRIVLADPRGVERCHVIFLDERRAYLADASLGVGSGARLSLRMRDLFDRALAVGAAGLIIAHNHPSGECRPSQCDIEATQRLKQVATALDVELIDHFILTERGAYSMRAGGEL